MLDLSLKGRTALVCGASSGIGAATARIFAEQGARVVALARRENELEKLIAELPGTGHVALSCDLLQREDLKKKLQIQLANLGGAIEILVCNASGPKGGPITEATEEDFVTTFAQHLLANQTLVQALLPGMKDRGYGRIINVISTSVRTPIPNLGVSNTIRGAVASWAKTLSVEVASFGVTVNSVLPGYTMTARLDEILKAGAAARGVTEDVVAAELKKTIPAGRFGEAKEVASAIAFYASPAAAYINGTVLAVDGGRLPTI